MKSHSAEQSSSEVQNSRKKGGWTQTIFLLILMLFSGTALPCHALEVIFRGTASVAGPSVTLGDIADFHNGSEQPELATSLAGKTVSASPEAGKKSTLNTRNIIQHLSRTIDAPETVTWGGADSINVSRQGVTITAQAVQEIIDAFLAEQSTKLAGVRCSFTPTDPPLPFIVPTGNLRWEVTPSNPAIIGSNRFSLIARMETQVIKNFSVRGTLKSMATAAVAVSNLQRDDLISKSQIHMESVDISSIRTPCLQMDQVVGKKVLRTIKAGSAIELTDIELPLMVKKGALVKILGQKNGLTLTATGIAKTDGKEGQVIKVKNTGSEKEIFCRVTAPGFVEVQI
jgi:flagellar basal body P-ring formation protein FlgA